MPTPIPTVGTQVTDGPVRRPGIGARALLALIREHPSTRGELMERTGLTRSMVALHLDRLTAMGLITNGEHLPSGGGRPPELLSFNTTAGLIVACLIGDAEAHIAVTDFGGTVLAECLEDIDMESDPDTTVQRLVERWTGLLADTGCEASISAIALGVPWLVDPTGERIRDASRAPNWDGFKLADAVAARNHVPIVVERDGILMAVGEQLLHCPTDRDLIFVKLDASTVSAGILAGGRVLRGASGSAGDIAHVHVPGSDGHLCACGGSGCLEAVASGDAVARRLTETGVQVNGLDDLKARVASGVPEAVFLMREAGRALGAALSTIVNTANPSTVVLGGWVADMGAPMLAAVRGEIYKTSRAVATHDLRVIVSPSWERAAVAGAVRLAVDCLLAPDTLEAKLAGVVPGSDL